MTASKTGDKPPLYILTAKDYGRLEQLVNATTTDEFIRGLLRSKLSNSTVVFGTDIPPDIVTIGSRIRVSLTGRDAGDLLVGCEAGLVSSSGVATLDLETARAIALLGCKAGQRVIVPAGGSFVESIELLEVVAQPESVARSGSVVAFPARRLKGADHEGPDDPGPTAA